MKKPPNSSKTASTLISLSTVWLPLTSCISSLFSSGAFKGSWQQLLLVGELDFRVKNRSNPAAVQGYPERNVKQIKWNCRVNVTLCFCHLFPLSVNIFSPRSDPLTWFICWNQPNKRCSDYRVQFSCHPPFLRRYQLHSLYLNVISLLIHNKLESHFSFLVCNVMHL